MSDTPEQQLARACDLDAWEFKAWTVLDAIEIEKAALSAYQTPEQAARVAYYQKALKSLIAERMADKRRTLDAVVDELCALFLARVVDSSPNLGGNRPPSKKRIAVLSAVHLLRIHGEKATLAKVRRKLQDTGWKIADSELRAIRDTVDIKSLFHDARVTGKW